MFELNEVQRAVEQMVRRFCAERIEPQIDALERSEISPYALMGELSAAFGMRDMLAGPLRARAERLRASKAGSGGERAAVGEAAAGGDSGGAGQPEAAGSLAGDPAVSAVFAKELSRVSPGLCLCVASNIGCGSTIASKGDAELIERCALPVLALERVGCWALTEPESGSDAFAMRTTVRIEGDAAVLHGSKTLISNAPQAEVFLIYARLVDARSDAGERRDKRRIYPVVVERGAEGLSTGPAMAKLGMHACPTGEIFLDEVRVPRSHLLGDPNEPARVVAEQTLATERAAIVAMCLGVIERCLSDAVAYSIDRQAFGKPIAAHQLVQQKLARMFVAEQNVRNLMLQLIWLAGRGGGSERQVSAAKWYATEAAAAVALEAVQLLGGAGYTRAHAAERLFRDIKLWTIGGGTSEIQQLTIAKDLLRQQRFAIDLGGGWRDERPR